MALPSAVPLETTLELAMFGLAEDLELPPRRVRHALLPFVRRLRAGNLPLDAAERVLESMLRGAGALALQAGPFASVNRQG